MAKEIYKELKRSDARYEPAKPYLQDIVKFGSHKRTGEDEIRQRQTDHRPLCDHPDRTGYGSTKRTSNLSQRVYDVIVRRFLSIFYPPAVYQKVSIVTKIKEESFFSSFKVLAEEGYLKVTGVPGGKNDNNGNTDSSADSTEDKDTDADFFARIQSLKKGTDPSGAVPGHQRRQDLAAEALLTLVH